MFKIQQGYENVILRTVSLAIKPSQIQGAAKLGKDMVKYIKNPDNG